MGDTVASLKTLDRPELLGDRVYVTLREHLCSGLVPSGQPLQESALAAQLGVSRTPVREALARLASEGLLGSDGRSFIVPSLSEADIDDIYELRLLLEPEALRQGATRIREKAQIAPFREQLAAMVTPPTSRTTSRRSWTRTTDFAQHGWTSFQTADCCVRLNFMPITFATCGPSLSAIARCARWC